MCGWCSSHTWKLTYLSDNSKTELFKFLSVALMRWFYQEELVDKQPIITDGEAVLIKPPLPDLASLSPCNHEEADSHMLLRTFHAAQHDHHTILIRTVGTDVVVLACQLVAHGLPPEDELWLAFRTDKNLSSSSSWSNTV